MKQYTVLESVIKKKIPHLDTLPTEDRKKIFEQILNENWMSILLEIKLPDPIDFKMKIMRERFRDLRRRKEAKRGDQNFNYNLWRKLYEAKNRIKYNILANTHLSKVDETDTFASSILTEKNISANVDWVLPKEVPARSILKNINQITSNVEISSELQTKMVHSEHYREFVNCINNTCKSYRVEKLGFAEYLLYEKKDIENPKWKKIILDAQLYEKDFEKKLYFWEQLRIMIDESLDKLKNNTKSLDEVIELEKRFYINLCQ